MATSQVQQIKDEKLRGLMEQAERALDEGDNTACVHRCADAYLLTLEQHEPVLAGLRKVMQAPRVKAGLENGTLRFAPLMFPRLAAKLTVPEAAHPSIAFARDSMGFGEAVQYYEFTLNLIGDAERGVVSMGDMAGGL